MNFESAYRIAHPEDRNGALVAGWLIANRAAKRHRGFAVVSPEVKAAMSRVDVSAVERWLYGAAQ